MRRLFLLTVVAWMLPAASFAIDGANSLKQNMKQLGALNKALTTSAKDPSQNATNAENANKMVAVFKLVYNQADDAMDSVPADKKEAAVADFHKLIQNESDLAAQLLAAFIANDNGTAVVILQKMNDIKHEGHDRFDP